MTFEFREYRTEYIRFGHGPATLLAFHGFGQQPEVFYNLEASLGKHFTVYSFALFHHGGSTYPPGKSPDEPLDLETFRELLEAFCTANNIGEFSLMGYSLGGKVALQYMQLMPERVRSLILLAPDGIKKSFWYHYATQNTRGKKLFRKMVQRPDLFFRLIKYLRMMGIVSGKMEKFTISQFSDEVKRKKVFNVWNTYSLLLPKVSKTRETIRSYRIPTVIFTGTYDPVLNAMIGKILVTGMEEFVHWKPITAGHDLVKETYNDTIYPVLREFIYQPLNL